MPKFKTGCTRNLTATSFRVDENHGDDFTLVIFANSPGNVFSKTKVRIDFDDLPGFMPQIRDAWMRCKRRREERIARISASLPPQS